MQTKVSLISFVLLVLLFAGCKDSLVRPDLFNSDVYEYLPIEIGNSWIYDFSTSAERAIVKREIKNKLIHEDGSIIYGYTEGTLVNNPDPDRPIAGYYCKRADAVYYYSSPNDTAIPGTSILCKKIPIIKAPLTIGVSWIVENDTFNLSAFTSIVVNEQTYDKTILVVSRKSNYVDSTWFSKNVGIVRRKIILFDSITEWNLKSYLIY